MSGSGYCHIEDVSDMSDGVVQVVRCALENAASVARTFLMSDVVVRPYLA